MCVCVCVCVNVIVNRPVFPPCAVDGCSRNPLYYYYFYSVLELGRADSSYRAESAELLHSD